MEIKKSNKGLGFLSILTLIFVVAKLLGLINWSWIIVFSPIFLGVIWTVLCLIVILIVALIYSKF